MSASDQRPEDQASGSADGGGDGGAPHALPDGVEPLLRELGSTLGKFAIYPPDHPILGPALGDLEDRLDAVLRDRGELTVRVRRRRLAVGDGTTDPDDSLLRDLAGRLHGHQLRAVAIRPGVADEELRELVRSLSREPTAGDGPLGLTGTDRDWPHVDVRGRRYDPLRLESGVPERPAEGARGGDEAAPLGLRLAGADLLEGTPEDVARRVEQRLQEEDLDRVLAMQMFRLAERLGDARGDTADRVRRRLSRVILSLPSEVLSMLLELYRESAEDERFLLSAARGMEVEATLRLVQAATADRDGDIGEWLLGLVLRLSMYDEETATRPTPGSEAIDELIDRILDAWDLEDPRPTVYQSTLRRMARNPPDEAGLPDQRARAVFLSPERILKMGLEMDEQVGHIREAADQMIRSGRFGTLADLLEGAPEDNLLAEELWARLAVPAVVERLLTAEPPGFPLVERLTRVAGVELAPPLLDALGSPRSEARTYWRKVFNLLVDIGQPVAPLVPPRLSDGRWYVRRTLLSLLREFPRLPVGFTALPYLEEPDPRVRAEALALALEAPEEREAALLAALDDDDTRMVSLGLSAAEADCPPAAVPRLARLLTDPGQAPSHRRRAARLLGDADSEVALDALLGTVWTPKWLFWRRIAPPSPLVVEALEALAHGWSEADDAREALRAAARSDREELRAAVRIAEREEGPGSDEGASPGEAAGEGGSDRTSTDAGDGTSGEGERATPTEGEDARGAGPGRQAAGGSR